MVSVTHIQLWRIYTERFSSPASHFRLSVDASLPRRQRRIDVLHECVSRNESTVELLINSNNGGTYATDCRE